MNERFIINTNGTVSDPSTGLMWQQESAGKMTYEDAVSYCKNLTLGGYNDWRAPSVEELFCLANRSRGKPAIDTNAFPDTMSSFYWSSTTHAYYTNFAWGVSFYYGYVCSNYKSNAYYVRAVRSGQCG